MNIEAIFNGEIFQCKVLYYINEIKNDFLQVIPDTCIKALIRKGIAYPNEENMLKN